MLVRFEKCNDCCVWMNAGVLSYKRCDRNFDCEHCPLDSVLQREFPRAAGRAEDMLRSVRVPIAAEIPEEVATLLKPYSSVSLHTEYRYTPGQLWVQQLPGGYFRVGIDAYLLRILPKNADIITLAAESDTEMENPFGWIYLGGCTVPLLSPFRGSIVRRNGSFGKVTNDIRTSPYERGWLAVIKSDETAGEHSPLASVDEAERHIQSMMTEFMDSAAQALLQPPLPGICLNDGGQPVEDLEMAFGDDSYQQFIVEKLNAWRKT